MTKFTVMPGHDGRKMSKSYGNTIAISDEPSEITKKVLSMVTDPARIKKSDPGHPEVCSVFAYHNIYSAQDVERIRKSCEDGSIGCVECKKVLAEKVVDSLKTIHSKRKELLEKPHIVSEILARGKKKASEIAIETLLEAKKAMGLK